MGIRTHNYEKDRVYSTDFHHTTYYFYDNYSTFSGERNHRLHVVFRIYRRHYFFKTGEKT